MTFVKAKKHLGQHFLKDENIAQKIVNSLSEDAFSKVLEIGPGMGVLTKYLFQKKNFETKIIDIDRESIAFLKNKFPDFKNNILEGDFLQQDISGYFNEPFAIIGNFPYNISSQILFKVLENKNQVVEIVGMFQKEVAERIAAKTRTKAYGILSVLVQAFFETEYLFTVNESVFAPPPKVKSAVIRLKRKQKYQLDCDEKLFFDVVKTGFNQRRKMLRNGLSKFQFSEAQKAHPFFTKRAEELTVDDFVEITNWVSISKK
ncbi:MAG TPA: 16S rRNA (adenine(1518)-N(6)/adenine(1519)-N(6))-dimethyltransferase RsmA [Bacteroidia bacterium]|nr:16S rRNA (adenine(1518)-N(6)/adenine(1519)-N(6))-dimethyltransferase RsmA [Bacteroidia bacterium]